MIESRKSVPGYARNKAIAHFFGTPMLKGTYMEIEQEQLNPQTSALFYSHPNGEIWTGDAVPWLRSLESASVDLVFADPPYNIKKAEWDTFESQEEYVTWSMKWIEQAARILKPTGTLYICGFSEILADLKLPASRFFQDCRWLVWHYKNKANLGNDWGRSHESILHFRKTKAFTFNVDDVRTPYGNHTLKYPEHPQAETSQYGKGDNKDRLWHPHPKGAKPRDVIEIPTTCNGMHEKTPHPTQKPEELLRKIILASSNPGDVVIDPFLGSGTKNLRLSKLLTQFVKLDLLVLDKLGFIPFREDGAQLLFQLCSDLNERVSIIVTTNLRFGEWNRLFGDEKMTAALLDRLTHKAHILEFVGESYRFRQRLLQEEQQEKAERKTEIG